MNGTEFWKKRVLEVIQEHGLVIEIDSFGGDYMGVTDKTVQQIAESMQDAHLEYLEDFDDCRDCAGHGYFKPEYEPCQTCGMSGKVSIL